LRSAAAIARRRRRGGPPRRRRGRADDVSSAAPPERASVRPFDDACVALSARRPRFKLLFGEAGEGYEPAQPVAAELFGWGVIYTLHSRSCIERGRLWQAEHYVGAVRDHALGLACLREGIAARQARRYDDLSAQTHEYFAEAHVGAREPGALRTALAAASRELLREGADADVPQAGVVASRLDELSRPG
jgi:hypothetical protein